MSRDTLSLGPRRLSRVTMAFLCVFVTFPLFSSGQERFDGRSFESTRTRIHFEVIGKGARAPFILINGGPGFSHTYLHLSGAWEELAHDGPVVFYDQRGTGRSQPLSQGRTSTLQDNIDDLEALRRHLNYEKVTLVSYRIHEKIPNSKLVFFEKSGHMPFYEEPAKFVEVVAAFLNGR